MDPIVTMKHFNAYTGRSSSIKWRKTPAKTTGWDIEGNLLEKIPILALRNRDMEENSPLSWEPDRNLRHAINLALERLKAWQAFRPIKADKVTRKVAAAVFIRLIKLQGHLKEHQIESVWNIMKLDQKEYDQVVVLISETAGALSSFKSKFYPMLGSKIMHLLLPEFFPVWDTAWIKNRCLGSESKDLETWLTGETISRLNRQGKASADYGWYFTLMLRDLDRIGIREYSKIEKALIKYSRIPKEVLDYHFFDLSTIVFEFCLLGKHLGCKPG
jgi:hypothetical protein